MSQRLKTRYCASEYLIKEAEFQDLIHNLTKYSFLCWEMGLPCLVMAWNFNGNLICVFRRGQMSRYWICI